MTIHPTKKPKGTEPTSPKKTLAGYQLKYKNGTTQNSRPIATESKKVSLINKENKNNDMLNVII